MFLTFAPGGGEKRKVAGSMRAKLACVNESDSGAAVLPRAYTAIRNGRRCVASMSISTRRTSVAAVRGSRLSAYAGRPATETLGPTVTAVLGVTDSSASRAIAIGSIDGDGSFLAPAGRRTT